MTDGGGEVARGFPHLTTVRAAVTALYRHLSPEVVRSFTSSVLPVDVALDDAEDLHTGVARIARAMVHQLRLPDARTVVAFRDMADAAHVDLAGGPEYRVALNTRFDRHRRDVGAALAHEVTHVFLHRLGLRFPGTADDEILTDTVATYLGVGWLLLDAFRQDALTRQKFGHLTPEEYGYVLAKRALVFDEDPRIWFTSPQADEAYQRGRDRALRDARQPPLASAGRAARLRYAADRWRAEQYPDREVAPAGARYVLTGAHPTRVSFPCPTCLQRIRLPVRGRLRARCGLCRTVLDCET